MNIPDSVELSHAAGKVTWYFNGEEIHPESAGYRLISDGVVQALQVELFERLRRDKTTILDPETWLRIRWPLLSSS